MKRIFSVLMVSALVAACGGGGGSGSNERGPFAPVPDSVVYREREQSGTLTYWAVSYIEDGYSLTETGLLGKLTD